MALSINSFGNLVDTASPATIRRITPQVDAEALRAVLSGAVERGRIALQKSTIRTARDGFHGDYGRPFTENDQAKGGYQKDPGRPFGTDRVAPAPNPRVKLFSGSGYMERITAQISQSSGFARQNRYQVFIPTTTLAQRSTAIYNANEAVLNYPEDTNDWIETYFDADVQAMGLELAAFCEKTELPSYQFQMETNRHYGPAFKIPHLPEYQDITMTFLCGNEMLARYFFDSWMYLVMDPMTNNFNYIDEYAVDIDIVQYKEKADRQELNAVGLGADLLGIGGLGQQAFNYVVDPNYYTTLVDAFPIAVNAQELGYDIDNTVQKVQVTFSYKFAIPFYGKGSVIGRTRRGDEEQFRDTIKPPPPPPPPQPKK
jgi:hypothetical protein